MNLLYKQPHAVFIITKLEVLVTYFIILVDVYNLIFTKDFKYLSLSWNLYAVMKEPLSLVAVIHVF